MATFTQSNKNNDPVPSKAYYLAGPMSNIPQFNYPAFFRIAEKLRARGLTIQSPAELDSPETVAAALASIDGSLGSGVVNGETWGDFLARDVKLIADKVEGIIAMPAWHKSKGARLEVFVAMLAGKPVYIYDEDTDKLTMMDAMHMNLGLIGLPVTASMSVTI